MTRARFVVAATLAASVLAAGSAAAQAPPMKSVLAGKKIVPPFRGDAVIEHTAPVTKRVGDKVVTTIKVRNLSPAPVARLRITETWYSKDNKVVGGGQGTIEGLLQPNEVQTITIETPWNNNMNANRFTFAHANGTVSRPRAVKTLEETPPKDAATVPAGVKK